MGKFDGLFGPTQANNQVNQSGNKFAGLFTPISDQSIPQQQIPKQEEPSTLTKIAGGFQEAIGGTGDTLWDRVKNATKTIAGEIYDAGKSVVEHPVVTAGSVVKGAMDFNFNVAKGISKLAGEDNAVKYIQDNQDALNEFYKANLGEDKSKETAGAIGHFVGSQIPYILGGEVAGALGEAGAIAGLTQFGGDLSLGSVETIGKITKWASDALGFMGVHQLETSTEEGSRTNTALSDLLTLSALGGIGLTTSAIKDFNLRSDIRKFVADSVDKSIPEIENGSKKLFTDIEKTTGKNPQQLAGENLGSHFLKNPKTSAVADNTGFTPNYFDNISSAQKSLIDKAKNAGSDTEFAQSLSSKELKSIPENPSIFYEKANQYDPTISKYGNELAYQAEKERAAQIAIEDKNIKSNLKESNVQQVNQQTAQFGGKESAMWQRVSQNLTPAENEALTYKGITLEGAANKAQQLVNEDSAKAYRIAMGLEKSPADTTNTMINRVLAEKAKLEGNLDLQTELVKNRTLQQIRRGQEIVSEREIKGGLARDSASFNMKQVLDERAKLVEKKMRMTSNQAIDKETQILRKGIKVPTKVDWTDFINSITCSI